jgi:uncharacterized protein with ATP-grasp and redox domains
MQLDLIEAVLIEVVAHIQDTKINGLKQNEINVQINGLKQNELNVQTNKNKKKSAFSSLHLLWM